MRLILAAAFAALAALPAAAKEPVNGRSLKGLKPVQADAARPCPEYGPGFVRVPGSLSCVRVGGRVRVDTSVSSRRSFLEDRSSTRVGGSLIVESRSQSEFGPVRTYVRVNGARRLGQGY
ncbi:MAG TPA: porin [Beijerinckiaceae bacterium]|jgi:hypothetical protein